MTEPTDHPPVLIDRDGDEWHWINGAYHVINSPATRDNIEEIWGPVTEKPEQTA